VVDGDKTLYPCEKRFATNDEQVRSVLRNTVKLHTGVERAQTSRIKKSNSLPRDKGTADICADNEEICPSVDLDPRKRHIFHIFRFFLTTAAKKRRNELHDRSSCDVRCIQYAPWLEILNNCRIETIV